PTSPPTCPCSRITTTWCKPCLCLRSSTSATLERSKRQRTGKRCWRRFAAGKRPCARSAPISRSTRSCSARRTEDGNACPAPPIPGRRFSGTMLALDPAFVPLGFLASCDNWIPDPTFVLTKRRGSKVWQTLPGTIADVDALAYNLGSDGHRYLFAMACGGTPG